MREQIELRFMDRYTKAKYELKKLLEEIHGAGFDEKTATKWKQLAKYQFDESQIYHKKSTDFQLNAYRLNAAERLKIEKELAEHKINIRDHAGEQSKAYRAMFAVSKAYALADVGVKMGKAVADAWADPSATTIWEKLANVAKVSWQEGHVLSMINAISPKGFATGGYTGNMGVNQVAGVVHGQEYVLNAKATKRIGVGNLERLNRGDGIGGNVNNININVSVHTNGTNVQADTQIGKAMGNAIKLAVQSEVQKQTRQGGLLYGR